MAANTIPIFSKVPNVGWTGTITAANTTKDGTTATEIAFTAGVEGSFVEKLVVRAKGTNVQTVLRIFINNGGAVGTAANNTLYDEITLPATTLSEILSLPPVVLPMMLGIEANWRIYVTIGTAVAAGIQVTGVGGDY